eukprot:5352199-Amphidinium_carterae.1
MAYTQETQNQVIDTMLDLLQSPSPEYSPATAAEETPQSSPSPSGELVIPAWLEISHSEALNALLIHADWVVEFDATALNNFWKSDVMHSSYEMLAPTWLQMFKDHTLINGL